MTGVALGFRTVTLAVVRRMGPEGGKAGGWQNVSKRTQCVWREKVPSLVTGTCIVQMVTAEHQVLWPQ